MIRIRQGRVLSVKARRPNFTEIIVQIPGEPEQKAYNYDLLTGPVDTGDTVVLNTTAVARKLGTGGAHFVMANVSRTEHNAGQAGHIMKLRYSPCQVKVLAAEEPDSPYAEAIKNTTSLDGLPVVVGTLHSMLAPAAAGIKATAGDRVRVVYVMTDGAALPLPMSNLVRDLKATGLVDATITCGHAFGGDWECVNIYTALLTAKTIARADVVIVAMGPGIVGTASPLGFTGVEQGEIINAVNILGGRPVAIPRISFADLRERHYGISHHTVTALGKIALTSCVVVLPELADYRQYALVRDQLSQAWPEGKHSLVWEDGRPALAELAGRGIEVTSMGRSPADDPVFFLAAGAAGSYAARLTANLNEAQS
ncbi:hypothetical protein SPSYN_00230 [Sporotomaculum syntrophicum]|uniref:DUF3866 family protein n=1 Tax=Sporotomaculum syntrophicum TaxID=182264 RepID=A0A9D2WT98_9FIRM|nr:DUF3866 family protein [Sporotomaculum syntrophicum]KAF1086511.1 hypothetical protein SPSYN_00230 [Sporotomaculum syntrophicum]